MLPVRSLGAGPPCLLLHGFTGSGAAWPQACVDGVGRHGRLLVPDLPGHGAAHRSNTVESYRLPSVLDALVGALDRAGVDRAVWMGYSMGGRLALAAAVLRPERVAGLVLESASPGLATEGERAARRDRDHLLAKRILEDGTAAFVDAWMSQPLFASQHALGEATLQAERSRRLRNDGPALAACLEGLGTGSQPSFWDRLGEIRVPSLVLTGALDHKFTSIGDRMMARMPDAVHEVVPDAGHAVHLERPREWVESVSRFLARLAQREDRLQDTSPRPAPKRS